VQGGLSLPSADYYAQNRTSDPVLLAFLKYVAKCFELMGVAPEEAALIADRVLSFEERLAEFTVPPAELRDREKLYNRRNLSELAADSPNIDWFTFTLYRLTINQLLF